jgi:hypothetical protein
MAGCYTYLVMLTKDDLNAISETINPLIKVEGEITRKDLKGYIDANNGIFGQIVRIDLAAQKQEIIEVIRAGFQEVGKIVGELKDEIHNEKLIQLEERVIKLEKQQSQTHH